MLHYLAKTNADVASLRLVLERGAEIDEKNDKSFTPLLLYLSTGTKVDLTLELIRLGSDVNAQVCTLRKDYRKVLGL